MSRTVPCRECGGAMVRHKNFDPSADVQICDGCFFSPEELRDVRAQRTENARAK